MLPSGPSCNKVGVTAGIVGEAAFLSSSCWRKYFLSTQSSAFPLVFNYPVPLNDAEQEWRRLFSLLEYNIMQVEAHIISER